MASDCERRRGLEHQEPLPRIAASVARGMNGLACRASDARVAGARGATAGGLVNLVVSGRPTGSLRFRRLRNPQDKTRDGRTEMTEHHRPFPGLLICPSAWSLGVASCAAAGSVFIFLLLFSLLPWWCGGGWCWFAGLLAAPGAYWRRLGRVRL